LLGACSATVPGQTVTVFDIGYASGPYGIAAGADGNLWFGETYGYSVGRITPSGVIAHFPPPFAQVNEIAPGPDGNMWFTETLWSTIGRITPAGVITEYLCYPGPQDYLHGRLPRHITAGPDGALWFANSVGTIGRITTDGVVSEFLVTDPSATYNFNGIAAGSDGSLWFTETVSNRIGRITTAGLVTEFSLPPGVAPVAITAGPGGALWFTEQYGNNIGRITTAGGLTEFPIPTASVVPPAITMGPDGNVWFTEFADQIGRITPGGVVTEYPIPPLLGGVAFGITAGPDGNLWLTRLAEKTAQIIRFVPPAPPAGLSFYTLPPCRLLDTRNPAGPAGGPSLAAQMARVVSPGGACGVPSTARALAINATVTRPTGQGFLIFYPGGAARPLASTVNYSFGQTRANNAILNLGPSGDFQIWCGQGSGTADAVVDVVGYFQ